MYKFSGRLWILLLLVYTAQVSGQTYMLSVESAEYMPIQGGQSLMDDTWDDPELTIPIGFDFEFFTRTIQELNLSGNFNIISLADGVASDNISLFILFGSDLLDRGLLDNIHLSPITRSLTGSQGSRVLTVEWDNAGFFGDLYGNGSSTDYVNFQLKLFEENGDIVFHFGPNSVAFPELDYSGFEGTVIGLAEDYDAILDVVNGEVLLLSGDPLAPNVNTDYDDYTLSGTIPENTVYRFSRESTSTNSPTNVKPVIFYYPNPTSGTLHLKQELIDAVISPVSVFNVKGQLLKSVSSPDDIDLRGLPAGLYELRFQSGNGYHSEKVVLLPD